MTTAVMVHPGTANETLTRWVRRSGLSRNRQGLLGVGITLLFVLVAVFADVFAPYSWEDMRPEISLQPPSAQHLVGTDEFGRDVLSRVLYGARISLMVCIISVTICSILGLGLGLAAGYFGGWVDLVVMRVVDALFAFPVVLLAIAVVAVLGPGLENATIALGVIFTPAYARVTRAAALMVMQEQYVEAARSIGAPTTRIMRRELLPNMMPALIVQTTLLFAIAIVVEAGLSFIGLGAQPPQPSWGTMLRTGRDFLEIAPWLAIAPGVAIFVSVLGLNLVGDWLRDFLDPRLKI
ncbi:MAG: ABC transporter permease [Thermomicrobiales bacterium]